MQVIEGGDSAVGVFSSDSFPKDHILDDQVASVNCVGPVTVCVSI